MAEYPKIANKALSNYGHVILDMGVLKSFDRDIEMETIRGHDFGIPVSSGEIRGYDDTIIIQTSSHEFCAELFRLGTTPLEINLDYKWPYFLRKKCIVKSVDVEQQISVGGLERYLLYVDVHFDPFIYGETLTVYSGSFNVLGERTRDIILNVKSSGGRISVSGRDFFINTNGATVNIDVANAIFTPLPVSFRGELPILNHGSNTLSVDNSSTCSLTWTEKFIYPMR